MPQPYTEVAADEFDYADDWQEVITTDSSPASSHLSTDAQEATLVGYVPWNKQRSATRWFVGLTYNDDAAPFRMHRENPQPHPIYPWLYAYDCSFTPFIPKSNPSALNRAPKIESVFDPELETAYHRHAVCRSGTATSATTSSPMRTSRRTRRSGCGTRSSTWSPRSRPSR